MSAHAGYTKSEGWKVETTSLSNGVIYSVWGNTVVTNLSTGASPITLGAGVTSVVYIARGATLTLRGGDGSKQEPGAPAICLGDPSAVLVVAGHGTLVVAGGNGGDGGKGGQGQYAQKSDSYELRCGSGGKGAAGGGAAAVAIGARSGKGGDECAGPTTKLMNTYDAKGSFESNVDVGNKTGNEGNAGGDGADNGLVYVLGDVTLVAAHGVGGAPGAVSDVDSKAEYRVHSSGAGYHYFAGGGGGGGSGAGGPEPTIDIGGGVGGGGGGGSGATGTSVVSKNYDKKEWYKGYTAEEWCIGGYGGKGGRSDSEARQGLVGKEGGNLEKVRARWGSDTITKNGEDDVGSSTRSPCSGGVAGVKGENGDDGAIYYMQTATLSAELPQAVTTVLSESKLKETNYAQVPAGVVYEIFFYKTSGEYESTRIILGGKYPLINLPEREHYIFKGYYSQPNGGGKKYYGANGRLAFSDDENYYDTFGDTYLYAAWELEEEGSEAIVVDSGETLEIDEMSGAAEYFQSADQTLFTIRKGGRLTLRNLTFYGDETAAAGLIRNEGTLVVSNCAFHLCSARKGRGGVYRDFPGAEGHFMRCTFDSCSAIEGGVIAAEGSRVSVFASTFICNQALNPAELQSGGGAFFAYGGASLSVADCTFYWTRASASDKTGAVFAYYADTDAGAKSSCFYNNIFQLYENCTNVFFGTHWSPVVSAANFLTRDSYGGTTSKATFAVDGYLVQAKEREVVGVRHSTYKPFGTLRTAGIAEQLYGRDDWPYVERRTSAPSGAEPLYDQLGNYPTDGYCGARTGNKLQRLINMTSAGGVLKVPMGLYEGVVVNKAITIVGTSPSQTLIDGEGLEPCVIYEAGGQDAVWVNFTFLAGVNKEGAGGGWTVNPETDFYGSASNCVFSKCQAMNGGAAARAKTFVDVIFAGCTATQDGGATYGCEFVNQSLYEGNLAGNEGGGSWKDTEVRGTLFYGNAAKFGGGGCDGSYKLCTFAKNTATGGEAFGGACDATLVGCIFYASPVPSGDMSQMQFCRQLTGGQFINAAGADFHLAIRDSYGNKLTHSDVAVTNTAIIKAAYDGHWLDFEGSPFVTVHPVSGEKYLYAGCYAFAPFKTSGMRVTGTDEWYPNTNNKTSLREAVDMAAEYAPTTSGELKVTFDDSLFTYGDTAVFGLGEAQIDVRAFTNATLVVQGPSNKVVVIDGGRSYRAFRVRERNKLRLENLYFQNCFGSPYGLTPPPGMNGGALLNDGVTFVSNCVFSANRAGNKGYDLPNDDALIGFGGAIATGSGGTSTVYAATFAGNRAAKGGAVWTADGGASRFYYSTFAGNIAGGDGVTDAMGGACAQERKLSGAKGSDLWLVNCTLAGNRVTENADSGGAISGAKDGLVLLNSVVVGNYAANATNDIAMPAGSLAKFYYTAYGTRTPPPKTSYGSSQITYVDLCSTGGVAYLDAIGLTNDMPVVKIAMPQTVLPLAKTFSHDATYVWTTEDLSTLGYGSDDVWPEDAIAGGDVYDLLWYGKTQTVNLLGEDQSASGKMVLGPTTVRGTALRGGDDAGGGGETPVAYDDEDQVAETNGVCLVVRIDGSKAYYASVEDAKKHYQPGDCVMPKDASDATVAKQLTNAFYLELKNYQSCHDWYDLTFDKLTASFALTLNGEKAKPTIHGDFDVTSMKDKVSVQIENVKPGLWYSLGRAESPAGTYVCEKWVQADDEGNLKDFLTASKSGDSGFYRVVVAPYVR